MPSVVTIHDCIHLLFPQYLPSRMAFRYARFMMGDAVRRSALVFTVSEASRADILRFYPCADPEKVHVVPNAIDAELLQDPGPEEMERVRERYQLRGRFVLFAGNVKPHKNLERLIRAFARVRAQEGNEDLRLVLIGDEVSRYGSLRRTVEEAGVRQDVRFFGFVPHGTLAALYRMAAVFAFPSLYEGFGLPPLEAMACGTPGRDLAHLVAARGGGRRRAARGPLLGGGDRPGDRPRPRRRGAPPGPRRARARCGRRASAGSARCAPSTPGT